MHIASEIRERVRTWILIIANRNKAHQGKYLIKKKVKRLRRVFKIPLLLQPLLYSRKKKSN